MRLFEKILCPIDFSEHSVKALQWTEFLAKKYNSQVVIVHVTDFYPANAFIDLDYDSYHDGLSRTMKDFLEPLRIQYESMLSTGDPARKIVSLATGLGASLIVMGTAGLKGTAHKLLGSTTESVVRNSTIPVLTISPETHAPAKFGSGQTLFPVARLDQPPRGYIRLRKMVRELQTHLSLIHVVEMKDPMFDSNFHASPFLMTTVETSEKKELLARLGRKFSPQGVETILQFGDAAAEILKEASSRDYDFLLLGARKGTFLTRFVESTVYKVISKSSIPAITLRVA